MPVTQLDGHTVHVDEEGFLTEYDEWSEDLAKVLAHQIGIDLTEAHWKVIHFLREDYQAQGETATSRRVQTVGGTPIKEQFVRFPKSRPRRWPTSPGCPSLTAASEKGKHHDHDARGRRDRSWARGSTPSCASRSGDST